MSVFTQWFGGKYHDDQLVSTVEHALAVDPLLQDPTSFTVSSKKGVLLVKGTVHSTSERDRVEELIRTTLGIHNLQYDRIVNAITVL